MKAAPTTTPAIPIDPRINAIASGILAAIPEAQVRLFGRELASEALLHTSLIKREFC
jgi:hypothetical protein